MIFRFFYLNEEKSIKGKEIELIDEDVDFKFINQKEEGKMKEIKNKIKSIESFRDKIKKRANELSMLKGKERDSVDSFIQAEREIFKKYSNGSTEMDKKEIEEGMNYLEYLSMQIKSYNNKIVNLTSRAFTLKSESNGNYLEQYKNLNEQRENILKRQRELKTFIGRSPIG